MKDRVRVIIGLIGETERERMIEKASKRQSHSENKIQMVIDRRDRDRERKKERKRKKTRKRDRER